MRIAVQPLGRRGRALAGFAVLDVLWGVRLATVDPAAVEFYTWLNTLSPLWWWSLPWFAVAAMCAYGAIHRRDRIAFMGAIAIKVLWGSLYLFAWLLGENVGDAWPAAAQWLAFAWCVWVMAGWMEPIEREGVAWTPPLP
ncbi:hypothetical protein AB0F72_08970 [Actinoplanes sp. NPDC023936]|uniref:hypothetical protein n=1 Tax=Actinoplanes sp. NPDC023936 TaxID=3154910 RepID=UPI0034046443